MAREIQTQFRGVARLIGLYDRDLEAAARLSRRLRPSVPVLTPQQMIPRCQLLIEAASCDAVGELLPQAVRHRRPILVMSTGGLLANPGWVAKAAALKVPIHLPSGALAGLDGVKGAASGRLRSVTLTTRKPPTAFAGVPKNLRRPRLLFQGSARRAAAAFPQNINVAATLALAGLGPTRTRVRLIADPTIRENIHEVEAVGDFGRLMVRTHNRPSRENPKTSQLAVLSAIATLRQIVSGPLKVGT
ncbi:MAG: DUF108 domain-containing protein [Candidatus Omnitrophica bacterium]|nr:DUF108 domain-containing protein [Candidatus Omnitrophota bacterium]